jgi:hypothetical protein
MQIDFHHAVTYILARLAGFAHGQATTVAYASQYVDNATNKGTIRFDNGSSYDRIASAHEVFDVDSNCRNDEDYRVWVPFHFLPGNAGNRAEEPSTAPMERRLVCTPDSPLADDMWRECRAASGDSNGLHRLGITAHVYADTFAHQLFTGIRHDINLVFEIQHIDQNCADILDQCKSLAADMLKLGHGGALTDPDMPFLNWKYKNSFGQTVPRPNPEIFLHASNRLFSQFVYYLGRDSGLAIEARDLTVINATINSNRSSDANARHQQWLSLLKGGAFSFGPLSDQELVELGYAAKGPGSWKNAALGTTKDQDSAQEIFHYDPAFETSDWKKFHEALKSHQRVVLDGILPNYHLPNSWEEARAFLQ